MSELTTGEVKKTGEKKTRKVLTPEQIFELENKRAERQKEMMKRVRIQKTSTKKRKNEAIVMKLAEKFNVEVKDIDLKFVESLSRGNVLTNSPRINAGDSAIIN